MRFTALSLLAALPWFFVSHSEPKGAVLGSEITLTVVLLMIGGVAWAWMYLRREKLLLVDRSFERALRLGMIIATLGSVWNSGGRVYYPALEDDYFRYRWDAQVSLSGGSVYALPPSAIQHEVVRNFGASSEQLRQQVSYADFRTPYPPGAQWILSSIEWVQQRLPGEASTPRFLALLGLLSAVILWLCLRYAGFPGNIRDNIGGQTPERGALVDLILLNPLLQYEWIHTGHFDGWMSALVVVAIGSIVPGSSDQKRKAPSLPRIFSAGVAIGFASLIKWTAVLTLPLFGIGIWVWTRGSSSFRQFLRHSGILMLGALLPWLVWVGLRPSEPALLWSALVEFSQDWEMNSGLVRWIRSALYGSIDRGLSLTDESVSNLPKGLVTLAFGVAYLLIAREWMRGRSSLVSSVIATLWLLPLLSPISNPWYFLWCLPLLMSLPTSSRIHPLITYSLIVLPLSLTFWHPGLQEHQAFLMYWNLEHLVLWSLGFGFVVARGRSYSMGV